MIRWAGAAVVAMGLALGACGDKEAKKDNTPTWTPAPDGDAIIGSWSDGANTFTFDSNLNYRWEKEVSCGKPPCPTTATSGTYSLKQGKVYLDPQEGNDLVIDYTFENQQKSVSLHAGSDSWNLGKK